MCEERSLVTLTDSVESRRALDEVWNDGGVDFCLEQAQWKFAMRASQVTYNPSLEPDWGYRRGFDKPTDWMATSAVCQDEYFRVPLLGYSDEIGHWFADLDTIYVKFVSNDASYGGDLSRWPATFADFVKAHFAMKVIARLSGGNADRIERVAKIEEDARRTAKNKDAMAGPTTFPARGAWLNARYGRGSAGRDGGGRTGNLIG